MSPEWLLFLPAITTIIVPGAHAGLQEMVISDRSSVTEKTMKIILESCYDDDSLFDVVVVVGNFNEFTDKIPMIRINNFEDIRPDSLSNFKPTRIIIVIDYLRELVDNSRSVALIQKLYHMASFFIIAKKDKFCDHYVFSNFFINAIINLIYICPELMNTSVLYTLNKYADYAPYPWKIVERSTDTSWFSQRFDQNVSCSSLNYDKTKRLDRHTMRVLAWEQPGKYFDYKKDYLTEYLSRNDFSMKTIDIVSGALNFRYHVNIRTGRNAVIELLNAGKADLLHELSSIEEYPATKRLFPHYQERIVAVIKASSERSTQSKILHLWKFSVIFLAFAALVILLLILSWNNRKFSLALLDVVRLIIYSSILTNIKSHAFRIFFTTILIMMIISNGVFQGKIAAFLTTHERNRPIERIEKLVQIGYKLYSTPELHQIIRSHCPECNTITADIDECINYVLEGGLTACLTEEFSYQYFASMELDLVEEPLFQTFLVTKCRNDWPLHDRMNDMWMRVFESGLPNFWKTQKTYRSLRQRRERDIERSSTQYQPIKLYKLFFAFQFLGIGLLLSTIVFIVELLVKKYRTTT